IPNASFALPSKGRSENVETLSQFPFEQRGKRTLRRGKEDGDSRTMDEESDAKSIKGALVTRHVTCPLGVFRFAGGAISQTKMFGAQCRRLAKFGMAIGERKIAATRMDHAVPIQTGLKIDVPEGVLPRAKAEVRAHRWPQRSVTDQPNGFLNENGFTWIRNLRQP